MIHASDELYIEPILDCNLRCKYCYVDSNRRGCLTKEDVTDFIDRVCQVEPITKIYWIGHGEITLWEPWADVVNYLPEIQHTVQTNGMLLGSRLLGLRSMHNLSVRVSVDGFKEHHERNRGAGTFKQIEKTLDLLHDMHINTAVRSLLTPESVGDAMAFRRWIKQKYPAFLVAFLTPFTNKHSASYAGEYRGPDMGQYDELAFEAACAAVQSDDLGNPSDTYMSVTCDGVYSCCETQHRIGDINTDPVELVRRANECGNCKFLKGGECVI